MELWCYLNGRVVPVSEAAVSVYDIGLLRGFGIYEAFATVGRRPFMFEEHMERFRRSTADLSLTIPASDVEIEGAVRNLLERNVPEGREAVVRIILTGGRAIEGIEYDRAAPTFYILVEELRPLASRYYEQGCSLILHEYQRQFPESKTLNYIQAVLLQEERKRAGNLEILYVSEGLVRECATSNFFVVKDGTLVTPKGKVLAGITRLAVLRAVESRIPVEERDVTVEEMYAADEAFLTSSFKDVVPVVKVGGRAIGGGAVGPVTKRVMELFRAFAHEYALRASGASAPVAADVSA